MGMPEREECVVQIPRRRIAMVAYTHYETDPRCRREATLAASAGWDVQFFALSDNGVAQTIEIEGITLHKLPMNRYRGGSSAAYVLGYIKFMGLAARAVGQSHSRNRFQIVHVNTMPDFMVATALAPKLQGAKVILDIHDVMPEIYMTKFRVPADHWKIRLIKAVEVVSARVADAVLTAEHPKGELLVEHGIPKHKVHVLLNLPDDALFSPQFPLQDPFRDLPPAAAAEFRLIYHGTLAHRLGMDNAIGAMPSVLEAIPGARLMLFGDGDQLPELHAQAAGLGVAERVGFSDGFLPIEKIIPEIVRAHLAVLPTRHEVSTDYMLPTKLLEYLALGIPAVFTPTHTVRHYFGNDHPLFLLDPTPASTAEKILWVANNYGEARKLTAELQDRWFSRFYWPNHRQVYLDLLEDLADGAR